MIRKNKYERGYCVFLSHSTSDQILVNSLVKNLTDCGVRVFVAESSPAPGTRLDGKVFQELDASDSVVALLTPNGLRSNWVQHEIGYAIKANKTLIPIVEKGVPSSELGALLGREYIELDPENPETASSKVSTFIRSLRLQKEDRQQEALIAGVAVFGLLLLLANVKK